MSLNKNSKQNTVSTWSVTVMLLYGNHSSEKHAVSAASYENHKSEKLAASRGEFAASCEK